MLKSHLLNYLNADNLTENHQKHECSIVYKIHKMFVFTLRLIHITDHFIVAGNLGIKQLAPTMVVK